jgi:hypothetical protein
MAFQILEWDDYYRLPETLTMDGRRIVALRDQVRLLIVNYVLSYQILFSFFLFDIITGILPFYQKCFVSYRNFRPSFSLV